MSKIAIPDTGIELCPISPRFDTDLRYMRETIQHDGSFPVVTQNAAGRQEKRTCVFLLERL